MKKILTQNWLFKALASLFFAVCTNAANIRFVITQNPVTGRMSGNIANTRFGIWRGKNVAASIGLKENRKPQTLSDPVLLNRAKMKLVGHTMIQITPFVTKFFGARLYFTTEFAETVKYFRNKLIGTISTITLDVTKIIGSVLGNGLSVTNAFSLSAAVGGDLHVSIVTPSLDPIYIDPSQTYMTVLVFNEDFTKVHFFDPGADWASGSFDLTVSPYFTTADEVFALVGYYSLGGLTSEHFQISKMIAPIAGTWVTLL